MHRQLEEYFNELKNLIFKGTKNIRADKFLISHIRSLVGTVKILNADTSNKTDKFSTNDTINSNEIHECYKDDSMDISITPDSTNKEHTIYSTETPFLNEVETWKGKKDKVVKRGKYLKVCPDIDSIHNKPQWT